VGQAKTQFCVALPGRSRSLGVIALVIYKIEANTTTARGHLADILLAASHTTLTAAATYIVRMTPYRACALLAAAATALRMPRAPVRRPTALRARTAEGMAPGWRATTTETGAYELMSAGPNYFVDRVTVTIPRTAESPGLGVLLEQFGTLEGGGGLTLVAGLVDGGNAALAGCDLLPGDVVVSAGGAATECLDYDGTVDALVGLPPAPAPAELVVKRLVKVPLVTCKVMFPPEDKRPDEVMRLRRGNQLRAELLKNRIEMPFCGEDMQCCKNCVVLVRKGMALLKPQDVGERQMLKKEPYWRLTCRANIRWDLDEDAELVIRVRPDLTNIMAKKDPFAKYGMQ